GKDGQPYLIDPSFLYGDRHFEIAFTEMFGGFSKQFYEAYQSSYPLLDLYNDVKPLYQLYYLLVHLHLFGELYGAQVDRILEYYIEKYRFTTFNFTTNGKCARYHTPYANSSV